MTCDVTVIDLKIHCAHARHQLKDVPEHELGNNYKLQALYTSFSSHPNITIPTFLPALWIMTYLPNIALFISPILTNLLNN